MTEHARGAGWGWHIETAVHVIRLILGGVFDRYPKLQIVIGHLGEGLPFMLQRLDIMPLAMTKLAPSDQRLSSGKYSLHVQRLQFYIDLPRPAA